MAKKDIPKNQEKELSDLISKLKDEEGDFLSIIKHIRQSGGVKKGVKSFFKQKNKASAVKTGFGSGVKTAASWVFNDSVSNVLGAAFDKKYNKKDIDKFKKKMEGDKKGGGKGGGSGISKEDLENLLSKEDLDKIASKEDIEKMQQYMSKTISKTQTVSKKFKEVNDKINDTKDKISGEIDKIADGMNNKFDSLEKKIEKMGSGQNLPPARIVKKTDKRGVVRYHDTATKKFASKKDYEQQETIRAGATSMVGGSILGLTKSISNIQKEVKSITKIANKILDSVTHKNKDETAVAKGAKEKGSTAVKASTNLMQLKPEPDAHFLSPEFTFLEADEQERITRDALLEAFKDIIKENPDAFKQDESVIGNMMEGILGGLLGGKLAGMFGKFGKGIGGAAAGVGKAVKGMFGGGAKTATAAVEKGGLQTVEAVGEKGLQTVGKEVAETGGAAVAKTAGKEVAETAAKKGGAKVLGKAAGKTVLKSVLKKLPIIGAIAGLGFAAARAAKGDWTGAAMEAASGVASTLPGAGTAASVGIDAALAARDAGAIPGMGPPPQTAGAETKPTPEKIKEATAETLAPAVNKTTTNVTNQTTVNKQAAAAKAPSLAPVPLSSKQTTSTEGGVTKTVTDAVVTGGPKLDPSKYGNITNINGQQQVWDKQQKTWVPYDTAMLAPAKPNPVGQNIIQGNQNIDTMQATAANKPAAVVQAAPNQIKVTNNTMLPAEKTGPKMEISKTENTVNRLMGHDLDHPRSSFNIA